MAIEYKLPEDTPVGSLRFVKREIDGREPRILQTYKSTWGQPEQESGVAARWYDVPLAEEADGE